VKAVWEKATAFWERLSTEWTVDEGHGKKFRAIMEEMIKRQKTKGKRELLNLQSSVNYGAVKASSRCRKVVGLYALVVFVGCFSGPWVYFFVFLFGFLWVLCLDFCGLFFVVALVLVGFSRVNFGFSYIRRGALSFLFSIIFCLLIKKKKKSISNAPNRAILFYQ
jgi:hypothetical protein